VALSELLIQVAALRGAAQAAEAGSLLDVAPELLEALRAEVAEEAQEQARVPVVLPAFRFRWVLLVAHWEESVALGELSAASGLDQATLRMRSRHAYAEVLARGDDKADLDRRALAIEALGLQATVVERASLERIPAPATLLRRGSDLRWWVSPAPLWQDGVPFDPSAPPPGEPLDVLNPTLAVPGEIVIRRFRQSSDGGRLGRKRETSARSLGESRLGVVDLHGPGVFVRIVENITNFHGFPGAVSGSSRRSLKGFLAQLEELFPGLDLAGRRICQSAEGTPSIQGGQPLARTGWPQFEEHTRLLRINALGERS
jgi:hypothetical protein